MHGRRPDKTLSQFRENGNGMAPVANLATILWIIVAFGGGLQASSGLLHVALDIGSPVCDKLHDHVADVSDPGTLA